jgi:hypothetical protein
MSLDANGKLKEEQSASGRPYLAIDKSVNARRTVLVNPKGELYHLDPKIKAAFSGNTSQDHTFSVDMKGVTITNDGSTPLTITVNGITLTVDVGESFSGRYDAFRVITIDGSTPYRGYVTD